MACRQVSRFMIAILFVCCLGSDVKAQVLAEDLEVPEKLRPLDAQLRGQLRVWLDARDAARSDDGKQTAEWWEADRRFSPLLVHGESLLEYAREHAGSPESFICLAYIIDFGEGEQRALYISACDELIAHHRDDPAVSWLCSRSTNPMNFDEFRSFLTKLQVVSQNPSVIASASFHLAKLLDQVVQLQGRIPEVKDVLDAAGLFEARPAMAARLEYLAGFNPDELAAERDKMLNLVIARYSQQRPWIAERTLGRLDYKFSETESGQTYGQLANELFYEIKNLRLGCIAPDFEGTDVQGQRFRLADRRGKPTLLMFSFKGCGACEAIYPALRAVQERFSATGFSVIGVMVDRDLATVKGAMNSGDISWPCVWDGPSGPIADTYKVRSYPTVILLDRKGRIVATALRRETHLMEHIEKLLPEK